MNILYLAHRIPYPPNKGDKLRSFRQLEFLSRRHRVWCACFVDDPRDFAYADTLRGFCVDVRLIPLRPLLAAVRGLWGLVRGQTLTESYFAHQAMNEAVARWSRSVSFDVVMAFSSSMAPYALSVPAPRRVLDLCDLDSEKWAAYARFRRAPVSWLYKTESSRLARREREWLTAFDASIVVSDGEARALGATTSRNQLQVISNGVELPSESSGLGERDPTGPPTVGFVGVMDYFPNVDGVCWFVKGCWPLIRNSCPEAVFRIVGRSPMRRIRRLASVPGVEVVGEVEEVGIEVKRFDVSVAPLRIARGLQNKVLEAMAWAKPVVLTSQAANGIYAQSNNEFFVADEPMEIAKMLVRLLGDPVQRLRAGQAAQRFVATRHQWGVVLRKFEEAVVGGCIGISPDIVTLSGMSPAKTADRRTVESPHALAS